MFMNSVNVKQWK